MINQYTFGFYSHTFIVFTFTSIEIAKKKKKIGELSKYSAEYLIHTDDSCVAQWHTTLCHDEC